MDQLLEDDEDQSQRVEIETVSGPIPPLSHDQTPEESSLTVHESADVDNIGLELESEGDRSTEYSQINIPQPCTSAGNSSVLDREELTSSINPDGETEQNMKIFNVIDNLRSAGFKIIENPAMDGSGDQAHLIDTRYMIGWEKLVPVNKSQSPADENDLEKLLDLSQLNASIVRAKLEEKQWVIQKKDRTIKKVQAKLEQKDRIIKKLTKQLNERRNVAFKSSPSTSAAVSKSTRLQENQSTPNSSITNYDFATDTSSIHFRVPPPPLDQRARGLLPVISSKLIEPACIEIREKLETTSEKTNEEQIDLMKIEAKSRMAEMNEVVLLQRIFGDRYWGNEFEYVVDDTLKIRYIQAKTSMGEKKLKAELPSLKIKDAISEVVLPEFYTKRDGKAKLKLEFVIDINRDREIGMKKSGEILTLKIMEIEDRATVKPRVQGISTRRVEVEDIQENTTTADNAMNQYIISEIIPTFPSDTTSELSVTMSDGSGSQSNSFGKDKFKKSVQVVVDKISRRHISKGVYEISHDGEFDYPPKEPFFKWIRRSQQDENENNPREGEDVEDI